MLKAGNPEKVGHVHFEYELVTNMICKSVAVRQGTLTLGAIKKKEAPPNNPTNKPPINHPPN